jgi:hypothetical protein
LATAAVKPGAGAEVLASALDLVCVRAPDGAERTRSLAHVAA